MAQHALRGCAAEARLFRQRPLWQVAQRVVRLLQFVRLVHREVDVSVLVDRSDCARQGKEFGGKTTMLCAEDNSVVEGAGGFATETSRCIVPPHSMVNFCLKEEAAAESALHL